MSNLVKHAPRFSDGQAAALVQERFRLTALADLLPSERDQNFRIRDETGGQFVLKIANATETREVLELQNLAMPTWPKKDRACLRNPSLVPGSARLPTVRHRAAIRHRLCPLCEGGHRLYRR